MAKYDKEIALIPIVLVIFFESDRPTYNFDEHVERLDPDLVFLHVSDVVHKLLIILPEHSMVSELRI